MIGYEGAPRYVQAVQALTGDQDIVPPGLTLESDRPENLALMRTRLWRGRVVHAALAANFNQTAIGTRNKTILSTCLYIMSTVDAVVLIMTGLAGFVETANPFGNGDGRMAESNGNPATLGFAKQAAATIVAAALTNRVMALIANQPLLLPWCLRGSLYQLVVESGVVNVNQAVFFAGYERTIRPEENLE